MGELMDPMPRWPGFRYGANLAVRARATAAIIGGCWSADGRLALASQAGFARMIFVALGRGHVHGEVAGKRAELFAAGDEIRLAVELNNRHNLVARVDVHAKGSLCGRLARALLDILKALLAKNLNRLLHGALSLVQSRLAVHHARAGHLTELLNHLAGDL
jgi:hypothetical protein